MIASAACPRSGHISNLHLLDTSINRVEERTTLFSKSGSYINQQQSGVAAEERTTLCKLFSKSERR